MPMSRTAIDLYNLKIPVSAIKAAIAGGGVAAKPQIAALTTVTTANATDLPTAQALANDLKTKLNAVITALKA